MKTIIPLRIGLVAYVESEDSDRQPPAVSPARGADEHHALCTCRQCLTARAAAILHP